MCARSWTCDATAPKMRAIAEEASALVRKFKGAYSGEHGDGLCRGEWIEWQFGPEDHDAFARSSSSTRRTC
jgi:FAD/FMN-containing dehydrogenase